MMGRATLAHQRIRENFDVFGFDIDDDDDDDGALDSTRLQRHRGGPSCRTDDFARAGEV